MSTLEQAIKAAILADLQQNRNPEDTLAFIACVANDVVGRRVLKVEPARYGVLSASELEALERKVDGAWLSAKAVWQAVRRENYTHGTSVLLGKQLSLRYPKFRQQGPTRMYWIAPRAIAHDPA